jgi:hypothetical protein
MKTKNTLIFTLFVICFFILSNSGASAAPPLTTQFLQAGQTITMTFPDYVINNQTHYFRFWVYNDTNGQVMTNASTNCSFYLMDKTGVIILRLTSYEEKNIKFDDFTANKCRNCFNFEIDENNFTIGEYSYHIKCFSKDTGGFYTKNFYVTDNYYTNAGYIQDDGIIITLFIILFIIIISSLVYVFIDMLAHVFSLDYDALDVAKAIGLYFAVLSINIMNDYYLGNSLIREWLQWLIYIGVFTHVVIPMLNFILMLIVGQFIKKRIYNR